MAEYRFGEGTKLLMSNGSSKAVESIRKGDVLLAEDGDVTQVTKVFTGEDTMYKIIPQSVSSEPYIISGHSIINLRYNTKPRITKAVDGGYVRYRVKYMHSFIDKRGLVKIKEKQENFSANKCGSIEQALTEAEKFRDALVEKFEKEYPIHEATVEEYLSQAKSVNHRLVGYYVGLDFRFTFEVDLDPYFLGIWLGDGTSVSTQITNIDEEVIAFIHEYAEKFPDIKVRRGKITEHNKGYDYSLSGPGKGKNPILTMMKKYNILNNKHIPVEYLFSSKDNRMQLLAGLIDSDGYLANGTYYEITQKRKEISEGIMFLARSLGFWCHNVERETYCIYQGEKKWGVYQNTTIGGDGIEGIPIKVKRKKCSYGDRLYNQVNHKIKIQSLGQQKYYGFELSRNVSVLNDSFIVMGKYVGN